MSRKLQVIVKKNTKLKTVLEKNIGLLKKIFNILLGNEENKNYVFPENISREDNIMNFKYEPSHWLTLIF